VFVSVAKVVYLNKQQRNRGSLTKNRLSYCRAEVNLFEVLRAVLYLLVIFARQISSK
jgi:hypothetical protein